MGKPEEKGGIDPAGVSHQSRWPSLDQLFEVALFAAQVRGEFHRGKYATENYLGTPSAFLFKAVTTCLRGKPSKTQPSHFPGKVGLSKIPGKVG